MLNTAIRIEELNKLDIELEGGADFVMPFVMYDDSDNIIDLTGATIRAQLRQTAESSDYFQFTVTHNGVGGRVVVSMPHEMTAEIPFTNGVYDIYITFPNDSEQMIMYGDVYVYQNVTKPINGEIMYLLSFVSEDEFPATGLTRRIYLSLRSNTMYRWNGSTYIALY